jgi:uncharacterized protein
MLRDLLAQHTRDAMRSGDKRRLATLRLVNAAIKDRDLDRAPSVKAQPGEDRISDGDIVALLQKMIKQRRESIETFTKGGRNELAEQEAAEIDVISEYLPKQLSEAETRDAIAGVVTDLRAAGLKDMGRVMAALKERFSGKMDFANASGIVKELLK